MKKVDDQIKKCGIEKVRNPAYCISDDRTQFHLRFKIYRKFVLREQVRHRIQLYDQVANALSLSRK